MLGGLLFALARFLCNESLIDGKTVQLHICEEHACILWDEQQRWGCSRFSEPTPHWPLQPDHRSSQSAASSGFKDQKQESIATAKWAVLQWGDSATILQWEQPAYMFITKVVFQKGLLLWSTVVTSNIPNTNVLIWGTFKHKYEEHDYRKRYKPITPRSTIEEPKYAHTRTHTVWLKVSNK